MGRYRASDRIREEYVDVIEYRDTGCEMSSLCTDCPLPQCKHDDANWYRRYRKLAKQHYLLQKLTVPFVNYKTLAEQHKCNTETVKRLHNQVLTKNINLDVIEIFFKKLNEKK
jgi:hypothetical protein